jgi:hypothetical protein
MIDYLKSMLTKLYFDYLKYLLMDIQLFHFSNFEILNQLNSNQFDNNIHLYKLKDNLLK